MYKIYYTGPAARAQKKEVKNYKAILNINETETEIEVKQKAEKVLWPSKYFRYARFSMFSWLEYIECQDNGIIEILNTLTPIHREMKYFAGHYIAGKDRYTRLTVASQIE